MAAEGVELMNKRYELAIDLIRYVFKVYHMDEDQIKLIKNFVDGKNIFLARPGNFIVYFFDVLNEQTVGFSWNYSLA